MVGVRDDHLLHVIDLSNDDPDKVHVFRINFYHNKIIFLQCRSINLNAFGDDHVSFTPMHISFSPCGSFILVSTGTVCLRLSCLGSILCVSM